MLGVLGIKEGTSSILLNLTFLACLAVYITPNVLQSLRSEGFREIGRFFGYYDAYTVICANHTNLTDCATLPLEDLSAKDEIDTYTGPGTLSVSSSYLMIRILAILLACASLYCLTAVCCFKERQEAAATTEQGDIASIIIPRDRISAIAQPSEEAAGREENTFAF
jgi:hypothetical protein